MRTPFWSAQFLVLHTPVSTRMSRKWQALGEKNEAEGLSVHIHVDGASGGFVAPFANPELEWDFRLVRTLYCRHDLQMYFGWFFGRFVQPHVCSINASDTNVCLSWQLSFSPPLTKFLDGLTYAGVGWAIWRDKSFCLTRSCLLSTISVRPSFVYS